MLYVETRSMGEGEFHQAVREVYDNVLPVVESNPVYRQMKILERLVEPERVIMFRVPWTDDQGNVQINRGFRVEMNSAIGPFQGGIRFHPSVNLSIMKFLAFEQVFQNSLTGLPLGGAKGGADFDPKGKSELEIMRFCQSFMNEMYRYIGTDMDIIISGVGVRAREIGYLFGAYKKISGMYVGGAVAGKGIHWGGSQLRTEAGGFGAIYFLENMLKTIDSQLQGLKICISGAGNVALYAAQKAVELGARVLTVSDTSGLLYSPEGFSAEQIETVKRTKNRYRGKLEDICREYAGLQFFAGKTPWHIPCDVALPAATQNEIYAEDAENLIGNGVKVVAEAADMPCTASAHAAFKEHGVLIAPAKAVNAGGVILACLETAQNASHQFWNSSEVEARLRRAVAGVHDACVKYGREENGFVDYVKGANIAGFVRVAEAMVDQGVI